MKKHYEIILIYLIRKYHQTLTRDQCLKYSICMTPNVCVLFNHCDTPVLEFDDSISARDHYLLYSLRDFLFKHFKKTYRFHQLYLYYDHVVIHMFSDVGKLHTIYDNTIFS